MAASLLPTLVIAKQAADLHTSTIDQAAAAGYLESSDVDGPVARLRTEYRARRDAMIAALPGATPDGTRWTEPDGGMFVWLRLPGPADTAAILRSALRRQVAFVPGAPFFVADPDHATLRLSFTTHTPAGIAEGTSRSRVDPDSIERQLPRMMPAPWTQPSTAGSPVPGGDRPRHRRPVPRGRCDGRRVRRRRRSGAGVAPSASAPPRSPAMSGTTVRSRPSSSAPSTGSARCT